MNKIVFNNNPELPYAMEEALNSLRINIGFLGKDVKKIMIVSSTPNEGKSFVTMQLFRQFAQTGIKTALIDADMRKSTMAIKYDMKLTNGGKIQGTSAVLSGDGEFDQAFYPTSIDNGFILPNIDNVINPSKLLENQRFEELLNYAGENFRYTLVDSSPLDLVSDGERIGSLCDGAILVVRSGVTSKSMVRHSAMQLERAGCPLLGVVLNRVESSKGKYYYKKQGTYYYANN
ncbi:CpsD/CapB family tyrosine-protein kinase [Butyrivibrio sp. WCE2006]|uniref:CpsD/CapB family tyrosine-protein kinase n=1 Tax=Butyrivibrio sp. WCE2006 TaxID=1410611 RepID=UPI0005D2717F|nr:CpsD/CapB family tyrosine-protein kinase [Butyrivibrio sp. WCE2006]